MRSSGASIFVRVVRVLLVLLCVTVGANLRAQNQTGRFDHLTTGFALTGTHSSARCESCHVAGVLKGTPRDCASCHTSGLRLARNNVVKPQQHLVTALGCDSCHSTKVFTGAKFNHAGVVAGACFTCHNGSTATGKPSTHTVTQASCDSCHKPVAWLPATRMDHAGFSSATVCASCHDGTKATGKNGNHVSTSVN